VAVVADVDFVEYQVAIAQRSVVGHGSLPPGIRITEIRSSTFEIRI
jgi:hypothetical protein